MYSSKFTNSLHDYLNELSWIFRSCPFYDTGKITLQAKIIIQYGNMNICH